MKIRTQLVFGTLLIGLLGFQGLTADAQQPEDILKTRSATENVVFGKIVSIEEHRLNILVGDQARTLVVTPETIVEMDGKPVKLTNLPAHTQLQIMFRPDRPETLDRVIVLKPNTVAPTLPTTDERLPNSTKTAAQQQAFATEEAGSARAETEPVSPVDMGAQLAVAPEGLMVNSVEPRTPAARAGLVAGDLIKKAAGQAVLSPEGLFRTFHRQQAGTSVTLLVLRDNRERTIKLTLPSNFRPELQPEVIPPTPQVRNLDVVTSPQIGWVLARQNGVVRIVSIDPGLLAALSDLKAGDEILQVSGLKVETPKEALGMIQQHTGGASVPLVIRRGGSELKRGLLLAAATTPAVATTNSPAQPEQPSPGLTGSPTLSDVLYQQERQESLLRDLIREVQALRAELAVLKGTPTIPQPPTAEVK